MDSNSGLFDDLLRKTLMVTYDLACGFFLTSITPVCERRGASRGAAPSGA